MSETPNTALEPEGAPAPSEARETPVVETPAEEQPTEREKEAESHFNKRIGYLRAQVSQAARERDEVAARLAALEAQVRAGGQPQQQPDPQIQQIIQTEAQKLAEAQRTQERIATFHAAGRAAFPDWTERCNDLQAMGADAQIAALLVEMPDGPRIAAALRDAPEEIEHIASLRGERARAIALGQFAAKVAAAPARPMSRAPAPPRPIQGRVAPAATVDQLLDYYSRQAMERRR
jgi:flagellar motility protein MotE (MotC chaperone)